MKRSARSLVAGAVLVGALLNHAAAQEKAAQPEAAKTPAGTPGEAAETSPEAAGAPPEAAPAPGTDVGPNAKEGDGPRSLGLARLRAAPPPPPPTSEQLEALKLLEKEAEAYKEGAKEYRDMLTMIVRHHYEERRRRILTALDKEIDIEKTALTEARADAIQRLEEFIALYSGPNAHPEATPDAMFRLAALYEERGRADFDADLADVLKPAIALYRQIIEEFPDYQELAAVYYYLGHAYTDAARIEEGQQAWRALVCNNKFSVHGLPEDTAKIEVQPLPQDHGEDYWTNWYNKNPIPLDQLTDRERARAERVLGTDREELFYKNPYKDCTAVPQQLSPGEEPRYVAEVWWQLGNFHFDQVDPRGGPYNLNRAMTAYEQSMEFKKPPLYGVAMYKRAWTYFKQQRYHAAVEWFVNLLHYADEQEEKTGDPGADFRAEAYTYIAGSLAFVDFDGPPADDPYIPRNDVLDVESDPLVAEDKMRIAIERVQDPELIPQDKKWTPEIYKALALEFIEVTQHRNAILVLDTTLKKFPLDRDAPKMQNKIAELYDQLAQLAPEGSPQKTEYAEKALDARTKLAAYVGNTNWTIANKDDPEALTQAEQLVRQGLYRAAADHTNYARAYVAKSQQVSDEEEERALIQKAIDEYRLAETGWYAYIAQDPTSPDAYESRFWLADARYRVVVLQVALGRTPSAAEVAGAREACIEVRDSNEDDRFLPSAAQYLVSLADSVLKDAYREYEASSGARGIRERSEVEFDGEGEKRTVRKEQVPEKILAAVSARDEYNERIPLDADPQQNGNNFAFQSADFFFVYGQFDEARRRFEPLMAENCGKNEWGYRAWEKLLSMSNFQRDVDRSRALAEGQTCEFDDESKAKTAALREPVRQGVAYLDAWRLYEEAEKAPEGPEKAAKWRAAAAAYKVALDAGPDRDEAPEAAMNGAYAYKQVGEYDRAIEMYELFIDKYGNAEKLRALRDGDPKASPPVAADKSRYEKRVGFLKDAYDALAGAYVLFFDYSRAADTYWTISGNEHFGQEARREAAQQAMTLFASLDDRSGMRRARERFVSLGATAEERAAADFTVASAELKKWDQFSPDRGANAVARSRAELAMRQFYGANTGNPAATKQVVEAAYWVAKMKRAAREPVEVNWWQRTIAAFDKYLATAPRDANGGSEAVGSYQASLAAEGDYILLDAQLKKKFDYASGYHRYKGTPAEVLAAYRQDAKAAKEWFDKLQYIVDHYASREWATAAIARQGTLYDSLRTGLFNVRPPELKMFDAKTEALLRKAEQSENEQLQERADEVRLKVEGAWRDARDQELQGADKIMVNRYSNAVVLARKYNVSNPAVVNAIQRLAFFTDVIGAAKMKEYASQVPALGYTDGLFLRIRPGLVTAPSPNGMPASAPPPAGEQ